MFAFLWIVSLPYFVSAAVHEPLVIHEQLNMAWKRELVCFPFAAAQGQCAPEGLSLIGPAGPVPVQLMDIEFWPGNTPSVKSAKLWFVVDEIKALDTITYQLQVSPKAISQVAGDLKVDITQNRVSISTSHATVDLPLADTKFTPPIAFKNIPAPLKTIRLGVLQKNDWVSFSGEAQVSQWQQALVANGPVFGRVESSCTLTDGNVITLGTTLVSGDNAIRWDLSVRDDRPDLAMELHIPAPAGIKEAKCFKGYGQWWKADRTLALTDKPEPLAYLSPDSSVLGIYADSPWNLRLGEGDAALNVLSRDPAAWVDPAAPLTYGGFKRWNLDMILKSWELWKRTRLAMTYDGQGTLTLHAPLTKGNRKWLTSCGLESSTGERLDRVKDFVLDWPQNPQRKHPCLFVDADDIKAAGNLASSDAQFAKLMETTQAQYAGLVLRYLAKPVEKRTEIEKQKIVSTLREQLGMFGNFDVMRNAIGTISLYDALIDSDMITNQERKLFRAQAAYLAYLLADPQCWSIERGMHSGNPNMSISYTLSLGVAACAMSDHPMAKTWAARATAWMEKWLTEDVGPNGEWMIEGSHYGQVSLEPMVAYAIAAQRAGFADFTRDERLKKLILYFAKTYTPPDPQRGGLRISAAFGRGTTGNRNAIVGIAAKMSAHSDPTFSSAMQWMWAAGGYPPVVDDHRLGGYDLCYTDRHLPSANPQWGSELFPKLGVIFRSGFGSSHESYVNILASVDGRENLDIWTPEIGGISQWFGRGVPLSTTFTIGFGYDVRHELLRNGVRLARNWGQAGDPKGPFGHYVKSNLETFAPLPGADYVRSTFTNTMVDDRDWFPKVAPLAFPRVTPAADGKLQWTRQVLFVKDADPAGSAYLVLRDTTSGGQPTAWQFWTLSEKIGTPGQTSDATAFLSDKPGKQLLPARELPASDRYTALGQWEMDVDYFIAQPTQTPRHTLRYGGNSHVNIPEYQDLLHLQQPGDGAYYVAIFPRPRNETPPVFTKLDDGKIIKVAGNFGSDFSFLASIDTTASAERVSFQGTAAVIQRRTNHSMISLHAPGEIRDGEFGIASPAPVSLLITSNKLTVTRPHGDSECVLNVIAPQGWKLQIETPNIRCENNTTGFRLTLPAGPCVVEFSR